MAQGPAASFDYEVNDDMGTMTLSFDWDAQNMIPLRYRHHRNDGDEFNNLLVFALPHHLDLMGTQHAIGYRPYCAHTLIGPACLLVGARWSMAERIPPIGFRAPRAPASWSIGLLADSLRNDINVSIPDYYQKGAGDTVRDISWK
jgi:Glycosyl hydrolase family 81 N-terminal domain